MWCIRGKSKDKLRVDFSLLQVDALETYAGELLPKGW